jgi:hypothetical protein
MSVLQARAAGKHYLEGRIRAHARAANVLIDKLWWSQPFDPSVSQLTITSHGKQKPPYHKPFSRSPQHEFSRCPGASHSGRHEALISVTTYLPVSSDF